MHRMGKDAIDDGYLWGESDVNYVLEMMQDSLWTAKKVKRQVFSRPT